MVIGKGLVAKGFESYCTNDHYLIFASGVSDSTTTDANSFLREMNLLQQMLLKHAGKTFVYFSTCSIYDPSLQNSKYVLHKLAMEKMIREQHSNHHIFRISNLAGKTENMHTFLNYFAQHIWSGVFFELWKNAYRNIIDLDDAVTICRHLLSKNLFKNEIVNIANPVNDNVVDIAKAIEKFTGKKGNYILVDKGGSPAINIDDVQPFFNALNIQFGEDYLFRILQKYF